MAQCAVEDGVLLVGDALNEVAVVGHDDERARPGVHEVFHGGEHVGIDVVGRFVQQDDVGFVQQQQQQLEALLLSAGEVFDVGGQVCPLEAQAFQKLCRGVVFAVDFEARLGPRQHFAHTVAADVGKLGELLVEHAEFDGFAVFDSPVGWLQAAGDQPQER